MTTPDDVPFPGPGRDPAGPSTTEEVERRAGTPEWVSRPTARSAWFTIGPTTPPTTAKADESEWLDMRLVVLGIGALVLAVLGLVAGSVLGAAVLVLVALVLLVTALVLERAVRRDPWRRRPGRSEGHAVLPPARPVHDPAVHEPHRRLPIGPGRAGASAAEELLEHPGHPHRD
jgi:hypothetical protein